MAVKGAGNIFLRGRVCWEGRHRERESAGTAAGNRRPVTSQVAGGRKGRPYGGMKPWSGGTHGSRPTRHYFVGADAYIGPAAPIFKSCVGRRARALPVGVVENRCGSSGRPTPTRHLPIELRKGRRPRRPVTSQVAGDRKGRPYGDMKPWGGGTHGSRPTRHYFVGADAYIGPAAPIFKSCVGRRARALPVGVVENRCGSSGRPTPTRHLPIELRRGRRPRRPVASQVAGDRKGRPYGVFFAMQPYIFNIKEGRI